MEGNSLNSGTYHALHVASPFFGAPVFYTPETASTMSDSEALLEGKLLLPQADGNVAGSLVSGTVLSAGYQTAGVGRLPGRTWNAADGKSALFTLLLHQRNSGFQPGLFPLLTGLAYCYFLERAFGLEPKIKWPNDVLLRHEGRYKKSAGILCRMRGDWYLMGMGINCLQTEFYGEFEASAVSIGMCTNQPADPQRMMMEVLTHCRDVYASSCGVTGEIEKRLFYRGEEARIHTGRPPADKIFSARVTGIDESGGLRYMQRGSDREKILYAGEVTAAE